MPSPKLFRLNLNIWEGYEGLGCAYANRGIVYKKLGKVEVIADFKKMLEVSKDEELRKASEIALQALGQR
jgi:hypothetical protein